MYRVTVITDGTEYVLHDVFSNEQIYNDEWSETMGKTSTFRFSIPADHAYYDKIHPLSSEIKIYKDKKVEFFGRSVTPEKDMYNTNRLDCVGGLSYLADSMQRPFTHTGNVVDFFEHLLSVHNEMVEERKRFRIGIINVAGIHCTRSIDGYMDTLTALNQYLVAENGGYLRVREERNVRYLDYLIDYGGVNSQVIRFGENLIDLTSQIDATEVVTCLIPEGEVLEITNEDGTVSEERVTISSVNGGKDYLINQGAAEKWGMIWGTVQFKGVTEPEMLLELSNQYLARKATLPETFEITAFDLSHIDITVESLKHGCWTKFVSKPHGIDATYLLHGMVRHITAPQKDRVIFGGTRETLSGTTVGMGHHVTIQMDEIRKSASREIKQKIENATQLITGGLGGYVVIGQANDGHPEEILIMDAPVKEQAKNLIRLNKNGLGFSNSGYDGPYRNAWTIDGNLVADFITTGTMLADRIRGGTLEVGGSGLGKDGKIVIYDANDKQVAIIDKNGISASKGTFSGTVEGAVIKAGKNGVVSLDSKWMFYIDKDKLNIGNNHVVPYNGRYIFETDDGFTGISPYTGGASHLAFWAAYNSENDYGLGVSQNGTTRAKRILVKEYVEVPDIYLGDLDDEYGSAWKSLSKNIIELWEEIEALKDK